MIDWSQVIYAGLGGGVGAALGGIIALGINKNIKDTKYHNGVRAVFAAGVAVIGMTFTKSMYGNMQLPRLGTSMETMLLESSPIYPVMKQYEPEYFEKITTTFDQNFRAGENETNLINTGRSVLMELLGEKIQYADGATLSKLMQITRQNYLDFKQNKPYLCVLMINQRGMGNISPYISAESSDLEQVYSIEMIQLPRIKIAPVDADMAKKSLESTTVAMQEMLRSDDVLDLPESAPQEKLRRICDIGIATLDVISVLPEPERSNHIRSIVAQ